MLVGVAESAAKNASLLRADLGKVRFGEPRGLPGQNRIQIRKKIAPLLYACFGPLSGVDKTLRFAPDAGQITLSKLAEHFFGQPTISAQGRQQRSLIEQV